jgi:hypothetical protein
MLMPRGKWNAGHCLEQHHQHQAGALIGRRHEGAADLGVGELVASDVAIEPGESMLQVGMVAIPSVGVPAGEGHAQ